MRLWRSDGEAESRRVKENWDECRGVGIGEDAEEYIRVWLKDFDREEIYALRISSKFQSWLFEDSILERILDCCVFKNSWVDLNFRARWNSINVVLFLFQHDYESWRIRILNRLSQRWRKGSD